MITSGRLPVQKRNVRVISTDERSDFESLVQSRSEAVKLKLLVPVFPVLQQITPLRDSLVFQVSTTNTSGDMICSDHHPAAGIPGSRATEQLQRHQNTGLPAEQVLKINYPGQFSVPGFFASESKRLDTHQNAFRGGW